MPAYDLILIHPPSHFDFNSKNPVYNAYLSTSGDTQVTSAYEMYPIGFKALKDYCCQRKMKVKIINLASMFLADEINGLCAYLKSERASFYGVDLHWQVHFQGAVALANFLKKIHKKSKIIFGGFTASYYARDLVRHGIADFVIRGFDARSSLHRLIANKKRSKSFLSRVPGLVWKDQKGEVSENPLHYSSNPIDYKVDWSQYIKGFNKLKTFETPQVLLIPSFGCQRTCLMCGGSQYSFLKYFSGKKTVFYRTLGSIFRELNSLRKSKKAIQVYTIGHWHENESYLSPILEKMKRLNIGKVYFELWDLMPLEKVKTIAKYVHPVFVLTPQSSNADVNRACNRSQFNVIELENWIKQVIRVPGVGIQIWFMIGLPKQTKEIVKNDIKFCKDLLKNFGHKNVDVAINPMLSLDPGSIAFDNPEKYGYHLLQKKFKDLRLISSAVYWKDRINYCTDWLSREDIFRLFLQGMKEIISLKYRLGLIPAVFLKKVNDEIRETCMFAKRIDAALEKRGDFEAELRAEIAKANERRRCDNSCFLYNLETSRESKWFHHSYC